MPGRRRLEGRVRDIGRGGDAVVETTLGVVFVPGALPGERVEIALGKTTRGTRRGDLLRVVEASRERESPPCPVSTRFGGCPLMIASSGLERSTKVGFLEKAIQSLPGGEQTKVAWTASSEPIAYRRRARLFWHEGVLGYRPRNSKRVTDVERCIVQDEVLQRTWTMVRDELASVLQGDGEILLERADDGAVVMLRTGDMQSPAAFDACRTLFTRACIRGVSLRTSREGQAAEWGRLDVSLPAFDGGRLEARAGAFSQANDMVNRALVDAVVALAEPSGARVLELHAGIGNFTVGLAREAASLVAVEADAVAVEACRRNLASRGLQGRITVGRAERPPAGTYDVIVLDPPRRGARELFESEIAWPRARRIVYVSCDTATLERDLDLACRQGFRIERAAAFDMFPQTAQVESVVRLVR